MKQASTGRVPSTDGHPAGFDWLLLSPAALNHVFDHLRPGAAVAAAGGTWPAPWLWALRAWVGDLHAPFIRDFTGFDRSWRLLSNTSTTSRVHELASGAGYLAVGHARSRCRSNQR